MKDLFIPSLAAKNRKRLCLHTARQLESSAPLIAEQSMRQLLALLGASCFALTSTAAIVTDISQTGFGDPVGGEVDLTAGSLIAWGYDTDGLPNGFSNTKSGTTAPVYSTSNTINSLTENYGWTFTFNDGTSPTTGTNEASSGGMNGIGDGEAWELTFSGIVSSTETRRLTLYLGLFADTNGNDSITETITPTLTGGILDEVGTTESYTAIESGTEDNTTNGFVSAVYTIDFTSATETDLVLSFVASDRNATASTGVSGYTLAVVPEPGSLALLGLGGLCVLRRRRG